MPPSLCRVDSPPTTDLDEHGRQEPPIAADETATLLGFLEYQRATFAWKCAGLDAAGLQAKVAASSMTLGWDAQALGSRRALVVLPVPVPARPGVAVGQGGLGGRPDWDRRSAAGDAPEQLHGFWQARWPVPGPWSRRRWLAEA
jgi:hypothetical protein